MDYTIEDMKPADWEPVKQIYLEGIQTEMATFQSQAPSWKEWNQGHLPFCRYVARTNDTILGWTALSPTSQRACYAGVAEVSIYIKTEYRRFGIGTALLRQLIFSSEQQGIWSLYCAIIKENEASIALHSACGFRIIGIRERIAKMANGIWHDVVLMERRSQVVGTESIIKRNAKGESL